MIPLLAVALLTGLRPTKAYLLVGFVLACIAIFCLGMGMLLSAAMVFFRDIQFLWGVLTTIWMYLTPIFYPADLLPESIAWVLKLNPLYYFITFLRTCIMTCSWSKVWLSGGDVRAEMDREIADFAGKRK